MAHEFDVVIRGGTVMDGNGGTPFVADVAVKDGKIAAMGTVTGSGADEVDATGMSVTPGFVDIHTHYDGQAMWDSHLAPSSWHGVTTVVMGNCGVGFAPVRKDTQDKVVALMEGVEDLPGPCLNEGLDWTWESFAEYLTALERRKHDIDFCALLPHAPMRVYVMGDRAMALEDANQEDIARMREITADAIRAGAFGFSTSRTIAHKTLAGDHHPGLRAQENELMGIALGMKDAGAGFIEMTSDWNTPDPATEFAMMRRVVQASGSRMVFNLTQRHDRTEAWKELLELSGQEIEWTEGMLYPVLHRLEREGQIAAEWRQADSGRERKYYRLTPQGRADLRTERAKWLTVHNALGKLWNLQPVSI